VSISEPRNRRLSPEFVLLGFLIESPSHGYELHQRLIEQFSNIWHTSQSQTYNILNRLESQGFIRSTSIEQEKLPTRQQLQITELGSKRFEAWLTQPTRPSVHAIRVEFITRLYFTQIYYPMRLQGMVKAQAKVVKAGLDELGKQLDELPEDQAFNRLALELRVELLNSVSRWLERCLLAVREGTGWAGK
jgi:PadR family transcriptional regulator AphA